jgi:hypothetical protein
VISASHGMRMGAWGKGLKLRVRQEVDEGGLFDAGLLPGRHEAGKIFRVGEEGEDQFEGVGKPLLGLVGVAHWIHVTG